MGFVFAASRRRIGLSAAKKISQDVPGIGKVGVFVNAPLGEVQEIARECKLDFVQLHGDESPEYCKLVKYPVIKGIRVVKNFDLTTLKAYEVEWLLFDSFVSGQQGGTGVRFDWQQMKQLREQIKIPLFVAGGLTAENVGEAVEILTPQGIDVSGGVETHGQKDHEKIRQFLVAARRGKGGDKYDPREDCCE